MKKLFLEYGSKLSIAALVLMMSASTAFATGSGVEIDIDRSANSNSSFGFIDFANNTVGTIINILLFLAGAAAVIYLIWAGIKYLTSGGDTKKAEEARRAIINAVIGIIIVVSAYFIIRVAFSAGTEIQGLEQNELEF